jgi:hypothetical protein
MRSLYQHCHLYVHQITTSAFQDPGGIGRVPVVHILCHWSGVMVKLRRALAVGPDCREYVTILVEHGETPQLRRRRMMARFGLRPERSPHQASACRPTLPTGKGVWTRPRNSFRGRPSKPQSAVS